VRVGRPMVEQSAGRAQPECIRLPVRAGARPVGKPTVRIFLGTEPAQFRANRVFLWSIEQVREPGREYEIYFMSELAGFDRRGWTTGFTNHRFAIPHLAGGRGRAIYNDEDQVYLRDPGELFDLELGEHGFLAISDTETSVMLIDCERMSGVWTLSDAQQRSKKAILRETLRHPGIRGELEPHWNARDEEYVPGRSKCLHYTTLHMQPWRPFPERFAYLPNPHEDLWFELERSAVAAGYDIFSRSRPTADCSDRLAVGESDPARRRAAAEGLEQLAPDLRALVRRSAAQSLIELAPLRDKTSRVEAWNGLPVSATLSSAGLFLSRDADFDQQDGVVCIDSLDALPVEDVAWAVEELFRHARRFVFAAVRTTDVAPRARRGYPPPGTLHTPDWWAFHFEKAATRHPEIHWELAMLPPRDDRSDGAQYRVGGRHLGEEPAAPPQVWVLCDDRPGNTTQSMGLAEALGWPFEVIDLHYGVLSDIPNPLMGARLLGLRAADRAKLTPPWPDLVVAAGRRTAPVARWVRAQSRGRTRLVQLGRKGANPAEHFDLAVTPAYAKLFPHPRRIESAAPLTRVGADALQRAARDWQSLFAGAPSPRIALLVGGESQRHVFSPSDARALGERVAELAERLGGSVFATTSRRTSPEAAAALRAALGEAAHVHRWSPESRAEENPYLGYLALGDVLVVTGESESMVAEACATGKPVGIIPLKARPRGLFFALADGVIDAVVRRAYSRPVNNRGTTRPQQGFELLCARLVERGFVRPNRDLELFHHDLVELGAAWIFDGTLPVAGELRNETRRVAERVQTMMGAADVGASATAPLQARKADSENR